MSGSNVDTTVRINSTANTSGFTRTQMATEQLSRQAIPRLGSGFGSLATQAIAASGAAEKLGVQGTFLSGTLSLVGTSIGMVNPLILGLTIAGTLAATMFLNKKNAADQARESLDKNRSSLEKVAKGNSEFAETAQHLLEVRRQSVETELKELEVKIKLAEAGVKELSTWERLTAALFAFGNVAKMASAITGQTTISLDEQSEAISKALGEWQQLSETLGRHTRTNADVQKSLLSLELKWIDTTEQIVALTERRQDAEQTALVAAEFRAQIMREQAQQEIEIVGTTEKEKIAIMMNAETEIELMLLRIRDKFRHSYEGTTVDLSQQVDFQIAQWLKGERAQLSATARVARVSAALYGATTQSFAAAAAGRISVAQAVAQATIGFATEAAAGELEAHAKVWAAEAIAAALTNPAVAATKLAALAAATAGAAFIRSLTPTFQTPTANAAIDEGLTGDLSSQGSDRRGRTLVNQGPVNITQSSTFIVQGNVFALEDIKELFFDWQRDLTRSLAADVASRT